MNADANALTFVSGSEEPDDRYWQAHKNAAQEAQGKVQGELNG